MVTGKKIRLLIVDDSAIVRQVLTEIFSATDDIEVVGTAIDPLIARDKIKVLRPDVLTLDIEMPRMDGITFLGNLMRLRPMPVVMISTLTEKGAEVTFKALELGAVDFVAKPKVNIKTELAKYSAEVCDKVRTAAKARIRGADLVTRKAESQRLAPVVRRNNRQIIAIGSSTGGTEAIKDILVKLPVDSPPIVITQHIPKSFSGPFARRLDGICDLTVHEAQTGMLIEPGHVYVAPGDGHLIIMKRGARYTCVINDGPPVNRHKPSVDVMFRSLLECAAKDVLAVMLTGMGNDGSAGMLELLQAGAKTTAQDEASSVVWGMPGSAVKLSAVQSIISLSNMAEHLVGQYE
ncbi:MAG: chemotaxis response regulator protein-glutamate methylesterase [Cycloclasticus sp. symbiont of Bathymodiolus heckerae]|nr:MAG: chemotaxis response regulator protein-glutamate methylesterase [Cycloclasticus sp. symbiont of Bathymodiolus heckerae]